MKAKVHFCPYHGVQASYDSEWGWECPETGGHPVESLSDVMVELELDVPDAVLAAAVEAGHLERQEKERKAVEHSEERLAHRARLAAMTDEERAAYYREHPFELVMNEYVRTLQDEARRNMNLWSYGG